MSLTGALLLVIVLEVLLRLIGPPAVRFKLAEKQLHCLSDNLVVLCPDRQVTFQHPLGFDYTITTNATGDRITADEDSNSAEQLWIAGDSIALGYGVNDAESAAYLLADDPRMQPLSVRNLGVDALGSGGIHKHLTGRMDRNRIHPAAIYWIFHASDFLDDVRDEQRARSTWRRLLFVWQFRLSRYSAILNLIKYMLEEHAGAEAPNQHAGAPVRAQPESGSGAESFQIADDHPTIRNLKKMFADMRERDIPLILVFYPEVNHATGLPSQTYPEKRAILRLAESHGVRTLNLADSFYAAAPTEDLYIPVDGHPAVDAQIIFAEAIARDSRRYRTIPQ
ncbi:MAG: hypothetical protein KDK30_08230 [Leptospiraceae bacterium]|nr:hypothetical protein [Leptospiraceae bacterium]